MIESMQGISVLPLFLLPFALCGLTTAQEPFRDLGVAHNFTVEHEKPQSL